MERAESVEPLAACLRRIQMNPGKARMQQSAQLGLVWVEGSRTLDICPTEEGTAAVFKPQHNGHGEVWFTKER